MGPDYRRPETALTETWKQRTDEDGIVWKTAEPGIPMPEDYWWRVFEDPVLDHLQQQALESNQTLQQVMARVDQARAVARLEEADLFPQADINYAGRRSESTRSSFGGSGSFLTTIHRLPLDLSYEVDLWGRVRRSVEAATAEAEATQSAYRAALLSLTAEVARTYFDLRELDAEYRILAETLVLRSDALEIVQQRVTAGLAGELDLVRAQTEMSTAEAVLVDTKRRRAEMEHALAVLCGRSPSSFTLELSDWSVEVPKIPAGVPSTLLERRPDVAEAERLVMAANARIGVAKTAYFPVLRLTGSAGFESAKIEDLIDADSVVWSIGPSVQIPVFTGGRGKARLRAAEADWRGTVAQYRQSVLLAIKDVEDALAAIGFREAQIGLQDRVVEGSQEAARIARDRYTEGLIDFLEVVDAERTRLDSELESVRIRHQRLNATVLLIKALGGSWAKMPNADSAPPTQSAPAEQSSKQGEGQNGQEVPE